MTNGHRRSAAEIERMMNLPLDPPSPFRGRPMADRPWAEKIVPQRSTAQDEEGHRMAKAASASAQCVRRQVGAAIYNVSGWYLASGHNGAPGNVALDCRKGDCPRGRSAVEAYTPYDSGEGLCIAVHAEVRAVMAVTPRARLRGTIYITDEPCHNCSVVLAESGLWRAVWPEGERLLQ